MRSRLSSRKRRTIPLRSAQSKGFSSSVKATKRLKKSSNPKSGEERKLVAKNFKYLQRFKASPNYSKDRTIKPQGIVLHDSCGTWRGDQSWILNPESKVSYHVLINTNGERIQFVDFNKRAWHAGESSFRGRRDCNSWTIGISFTGNTYKRDLTKDEIESAVELIWYLMKEYGISKSMITSHRRISPGRKYDPSPRAFRIILSQLK